MHSPEEPEETLPATPQACSTALRNERDKITKPLLSEPKNERTEDGLKEGFEKLRDLRQQLLNYDSSVYNLPTQNMSHLMHQMTLGQEGPSKIDESFSHLLSASDIDRDEFECKENWVFIPDAKANFSMSGVNYSSIPPPDFMPKEYTLFGDVKQTETASLHATKNEDMTSYYNIGREIKGNTLNNDELEVNPMIPSIKDISIALRNCDVSANPSTLMDQVMNAGKLQDFSSCLPPPSPSHSFSALGNFNSYTSHDQPFPLLVCPQNVSDPSFKILENKLIWGCVKVGTILDRSVHLVHPNNKETEYTFAIDGNDQFKIAHSFSRLYHSEFKVRITACGIYELSINFLPIKPGQALSRLKISSLSSNSIKEVMLIGYGGTSQLVVQSTYWDISNDHRYIFLHKYDLKAQISIRNLGILPAFYFCTFGPMHEYFSIEEPSGIIGPNETQTINIALTRIPQHLLNILSSMAGVVSKIMKLKVIFGEEVTRKRIKNLCHQFSENSFVQWIKTEQSFLLTGCPDRNDDISTFLLYDTPDFLPGIFNEGIHHLDIPIVMTKKSVLGHLSSSSEYGYD